MTDDELYAVEVAIGFVRREHPEYRRVVAGLQSLADKERGRETPLPHGLKPLVDADSVFGKTLKYYQDANPAIDADPPPTGFASWKDAALSERVRRVKAEKSLASAENRPGQDDVLKALKAAKQFIENGIEFGYIRMPDAHTPDSAHNTLPMINAAIASQSAKEPR